MKHVSIYIYMWFSPHATCDTNTTNQSVEILIIYKLFILKIWLVGYLLCCTNFFLRNAKEYTEQTECLYTPHQLNVCLSGKIFNLCIQFLGFFVLFLLLWKKKGLSVRKVKTACLYTHLCGTSFIHYFKTWFIINSNYDS